MPLTQTGKKVKAQMVQEYGKDKGERIFYATNAKEGHRWEKRKRPGEHIRRYKTGKVRMVNHGIPRRTK